MLKFIKMKYHYAYLLYYSQLFVVIVFLPWLKTFPRIEVRDEKKFRTAQVCTFLFEIFVMLKRDVLL